MLMGRSCRAPTLNPAGANQYRGHGERLAAQARALLERETAEEELGVPPAARGLLPRRGATLENVWPAPRPVEVTANERQVETLADFLVRARRHMQEAARADEAPSRWGESRRRLLTPCRSSVC